MKPFVSIWMLAYNHEAYIEKAIEGVLMQKTTFKVLLHIGEDCSTDRTREICKEYKTKYPDQIDLFLNPTNNILENAMHTYEACFNSGAKYIAMCEGDDCWTDPYKLQKQVDFLEANPEYGMVSGDVNLINEHGEPIPDNNMVLRQRENFKPTVDFFDLLETNLINTLTVCVRADLMNELVKRVQKKNLWFVYDHWFWLHIALKSKIRIFDEKMAAYRVHHVGASRQKDFFTNRKYKMRLNAIHCALKQKKYFSFILIKLLMREHFNELKRRIVTLINKKVMD